MFCKHCGKELPDDAQFCAACGKSTGNEVVAAAAPAQLPPFLKSFFDQVKALINPTQAIGLAAQSTGFEGIIGIATFWIIYALHNAVAAAGSFGSLFGLSLVTGLLYLSFLYGALFLLTFFAGGKLPNFLTLMNVLGVTLIPVSAIYLMNMVWSLIWWPIPTLFSEIAVIFLILMLYVGVQKMVKPIRSYFLIFCAAIALVFVLHYVFGHLLLDVNIHSIYYPAHQIKGIGDIYESVFDYYY